LFPDLLSLECLYKMVYHAPQLLPKSIIILVIFVRSSILLDPLFFLGAFDHWKFSFMSLSVAWALSIGEVFLYISCTCPLVWGVILAKVLPKNITKLKSGLQRIYFNLLKGLSKMTFLHFKCMHLGAVSLAFMWVCKMIIHSNKTQLWSHLMVFFFRFSFCLFVFIKVYGYPFKESLEFLEFVCFGQTSIWFMFFVLNFEFPKILVNMWDHA
jgi:hypothetical protein